MDTKLHLGRYSLGVGDRFARQARAQLRACVLAAEGGVEITPVWNKSNREHLIVGSEPESARAAADAAVKELNWRKAYFVDADHVGVKTVDRFLRSCDFFTIDVADYLGKPAAAGAVEKFVARHGELTGRVEVAGMGRAFETTRAELAGMAGKYLAAVSEAGRAYRHIRAGKGAGRFITEVSMDETDAAQTPAELLVILAALADEGIPVQTIAPKFTGRFNKGVDYAGDLAQFEREFDENLCVLALAVKRYGLPEDLKLSVHSGSDKFSLYPIIRRALARRKAGVHVKTAGTTWLEELIGLAESGGEGLALAKEIYGEACAQIDELCAPYAAVIDIERAKLPAAAVVNGWSAGEFAGALRHEPGCKEFNPNVRQLLHVGYKVAAKMGKRYLDLVEACEPVIARNVTGNLWERHIKPLFIDTE